MNSLKHGIYAETDEALVQVAAEIGTTYERILDELKDFYDPIGPIQYTLVRRIARCIWRMLLVERMEDFHVGQHGLRPFIGDARARIIRYERVTDIQLHRAIEALEKLRNVKKKNGGNELPWPLARAQSGAAPRSQDIMFAPSQNPGNELGG
jgi:hypothetical protein